MTTWIKVAIVAVANVASFIGGYFLGKSSKKVEEKKDDTVTVILTDEDLDIMQAALEEEMPTAEQISEEMHAYIDALKTQQKVVFSKVEVEAEEEEEGPYEAPHSESRDAYLITAEDMDHTNLHYIKEELKYFMQDRVLITEDESVVSDIAAYIGQEGIDALNKLAEDSGGYYTDDTVCVRNDRIGSDFEIVVMPGSYEDWVGLPEMEEDDDI